MSKLTYLLGLKDTEEGRAEIRDTWAALGKIVYNTNTKIYTANTIFKVEADKGPLNGAIVYCQGTYTVDGEDFPLIEWNDATIESTEDAVSTYQGVMSPFFKVLVTAQDIPSYEDFPEDETLLPFAGMKEAPVVDIDDDDLVILLTECGVPFLRLDELEYDRDVICQYMIKPALDDYYSFYPIIKEETIGNYAGGAEFKIEIPKGFHGGILYYVLGTSGSSSRYGSGAFALYREQMMYGGASGNNGMFGNGLTYRKQVPGFTGMASGMIDARLQGMQAAQGYANLYRREKYRKVREDGKLYAVGYSTIGGTLCAKWFGASYNWDDIEFEMLPQVRAHVKATILRNLGMLRNMIKSDLPGAIDYSVYASRADSLDEQSIRKWEADIKNQRFAIMRGGL